jgi:hypothetical protein
VKNNTEPRTNDSIGAMRGGMRPPDGLLILLALWDIMYWTVEEDSEYLGREELENFLPKAEKVVDLLDRGRHQAADKAAALMAAEYQAAWDLIEEVESERDPKSAIERERPRWQPRFTVRRAIATVRDFYKQGFL